MSAWCLFLDDLREPRDAYTDPRSALGEKDRWVVAKSTDEAKGLVLALGMPSVMSLDHDLGGEDTSMRFLSWLARDYWDTVSQIPTYLVHSANPVGAKNICSFMDSWRKSVMEASPVNE